MNFPTHLHDHWRGQRFNSFNRVLRDDFAARVYKIGLRLDFTCPNRNETADLFNRLGIDGVKVHNLHVLKNTALEKYYLAGNVPLLSQADYAALVVDFLERLNPDIVIHRLSAAAHRAITVAPTRSVNKRGMHNAIQRELIRRDAWQGRLYTKPEFRTSLPSVSSEGVEL